MAKAKQRIMFLADDELVAAMDRAAFKADRSRSYWIAQVCRAAAAAAAEKPKGGRRGADRRTTR